MPQPLKIALIADIHHGIDIGTKLGSSALTLLQPFVDWVNAVRPHLVVELGDRINDFDKDTDYRWTQDVAHAFSAICDPCVHILGNHDVFAMSVSETEEAMQTTLACHSRDLNGYHLVFWNSARLRCLR